jgi:UDP-N-acetyl-D-mannosaminuronic acid dehydrogenase
VLVVGLGYIGLPTAAIFASHKVRVVGLDVSKHVVDTVNRGEIHIVEPALDVVVKNAVSQGLLTATLEPESADAYLITVPTPFKGDNHEPDLDYVERASRAIAGVLKTGDLVILESTSPVGATQQMAEWLAEARPDLTFPHQKGEESDIRVAHCPERVLPGQVMRELIENNRIIGGMTTACSAAAASLYRIFLKGECALTDARTAELVKLTENSFRDVNIAFANELSLVCEKLGVNVWELIALANLHPRVNILQPGPGVGGHCIAVDPWFIVSGAPDEAKLIRQAREVNDAKPAWVVAKVNQALGDYLARNPRMTASDVVIACYGLAFKPNIDDMRESPALSIAMALSEQFPGKIVAVEPHIEQGAGRYRNLRLATAEDALRTANIHVLLVKHSAFSGLDFPANQTIDVVGLIPR